MPAALSGLASRLSHATAHPTYRTTAPHPSLLHLPVATRTLCRGLVYFAPRCRARFTYHRFCHFCAGFFSARLRAWFTCFLCYAHARAPRKSLPAVNTPAHLTAFPTYLRRAHANCCQPLHLPTLLCRDAWTALRACHPHCHARAATTRILPDGRGLDIRSCLLPDVGLLGSFNLPYGSFIFTPPFPLAYG